MSGIHEFIEKHVQRGVCTCGRCIDAVENPEFFRLDKEGNDLNGD